MFVLVFLWSEIKSTFIKTQKELGLYQRRRPEGTAGKFVFGDRPPLSQSLDDCLSEGLDLPLHILPS